MTMDKNTKGNKINKEIGDRLRTNNRGTQKHYRDDGNR